MKHKLIKFIAVIIIHAFALQPFDFAQGKDLALLRSFCSSGEIGFVGQAWGHTKGEAVLTPRQNASTAEMRMDKAGSGFAPAIRLRSFTGVGTATNPLSPSRKAVISSQSLVLSKKNDMFNNCQLPTNNWQLTTALRPQAAGEREKGAPGGKDRIKVRIKYRGPRSASGGYINELIIEATEAYNNHDYIKTRDLAIEALGIIEYIEDLQNEPGELRAFLERLGGQGAGAGDLARAKRTAQGILIRTEEAIGKQEVALAAADDARTKVAGTTGTTSDFLEEGTAGTGTVKPISAGSHIISEALLEVIKEFGRELCILSIGCGPSEWEKALMRGRQRHKVAGIDVTKGNAAYEYVRADKDIHASSCHLAPGRKFDLVIFSEPIDEIKIPKAQAFEMARRHVKKNGNVLIINYEPKANFTMARQSLANELEEAGLHLDVIVPIADMDIKDGWLATLLLFVASDKGGVANAEKIVSPKDSGVPLTSILRPSAARESRLAGAAKSGKEGRPRAVGESGRNVNMQ